MGDKTERKVLGVVGGGAAGFFAGINAARLHPNLEVIIFEKSRETLSKVRISGGGRCNVTHHCFDPEVLSQAYPRGSRPLRWAFEQFQPQDTVAWFNKRGIEFNTESDGRMFPVTDDSSTIIGCLREEAREHGVVVRKKTRIVKVAATEGHSYSLFTRNGNTYPCDYVVIATGGSNRASTYEWLNELGHSIVKPVPSLFTFNFRNKMFKDLAGISVEQASVAIKDTSFEHTGPILVTHWGLSGPAVLKTSSWAARHLYEREYRFKIQINWLYPQNEQQVRKGIYDLRNENARKLVTNQATFPIPNRLWKRFIELAKIPLDTRWAELSNKQAHQLTAQLHNATYDIQGKTTYKEEFVTSGGIPLEEIHMGTMESKECPNLFFAGEVLNIDGITGGYNFQSAWTTGWIAAQAIANI